ncbi:MAG: hydroxymethylglutaryl-CoA synthase family protein, partial [Gammaproteobacteria bacterium]|nr:hydroxymethylglutaryl-CoA synthase family protein [Gammaproteobacteria bacterium]
AVLRLIRENDIDPSQVGFLGLGTESSTCNSAGAVIVRGIVDRGLDALGLPRLARTCEVPEFKHACLGGVYALKAATRYVRCDGGDRLAIVVCGDVAEYERGSSGEQTQGAGAVAMLVEREARLFGLDLEHTGSASDYRGPDFRKPHVRHVHAEYAAQTRRQHDFPVYNGRYSTYAYLDETVHAVEAMLERLGVSAGSYYHSVHSLFFHRPYAMMPVQAMSFLYVRGMARGDHYRDQLAELCTEAGVGIEDVDAEVGSRPDLFAQVAEHGPDLLDPYAATSAVARVLRKRSEFRELLDRKMSLGAGTVRELGNLYSAALPAWIGAGLEEAAERGIDLLGRPMVAIGYGSGDAAEAIPIAVAPGWHEAAARIGIARALEDAIDLDRAQYEALHDGDEMPGLEYAPAG